jgi:hypothetical protein
MKPDKILIAKTAPGIAIGNELRKRWHIGVS